MRRVRPLILKTAVRVCDDKDMMEDIIQEGYVMVLESLKEYQEDRNVPYLGYLKSKIFYRLIKKMEAAWKYKKLLSLSEEACKGVSFEECIEDRSFRLEEYMDMREEHYRLYKAIAALSIRQRKVIIERFFKGKSLPEVTKIMGIGYYSTAKLQNRALKKIKALMEEDIL